MSDSVLNTVEKKVLGALLILADEDMNAKANNEEIARVMGYKRGGGAITFALRILEMNNFIMTINRGAYKILL